MPEVAVIGSGSWATALVKLLSLTLPAGRQIRWYVRNPEHARYIIENGHNPHYLSSVSFDVARLHVVADFQDATRASLLIFALPSAFLQQLIENENIDLSGKTIVSAIKGLIVPSDLTVCSYFHKHCHVDNSRLAVISGPCHAEEIALERQSFLTVSSPNSQLNHTIASLLKCRFVQTDTSADRLGIEYAAILKNIYAIAVGICHGLGYGDNFIAVLTANAMQEMQSFLHHQIPDVRDTNKSVYLGDLLVTCYSQFSRNRTFGNMIGKGYSVKAAQLEMNMIAEGYYALNGIARRCRENPNWYPIIEAVYNIVYGGIAPALEMKLLTSKLR